LVTENRELLEIDPFGAQVSRKLAGMPVLALPMAAKPGEEPGAVLLLYENGRAEISGRKTEPRFLSSLGNAPLAGVCRGSNAAVTLNNGRVVLLATDSGRILWTGESRIGAGIGDELRMIYDERGIYVLSKSGAAGFTEDGRRLWLLKLEGAAAVPAFGDEGILYSGGNDWILYAYRLEDRVKQRRFSLYGAIPEGNYGTANPLPSSRGDYYFRFDEEELDIYLGQIREAVRRGQIGTEEREFTAYLMETAGSLVHSPRDTRMQPQVHTRHRVEAARLLGYIGSRETIPFLANLYYRDQDSTVKAAAAEAIGRIGVDPGGEALKAFSSLIFPPVPYRDEQVLTATAAATGALCRFSGPPLSSTGIRLLVVLSGDDRPRVVRERARQELATLR
jgi:outer membrane protein assembly factor BamB